MTSDGLTPLGVAVREGHLDTIKYLIMEHNVAVNGKLVYMQLADTACAVHVRGFDTYMIINQQVADALLFWTQSFTFPVASVQPR